MKRLSIALLVLILFASCSPTSLDTELAHRALVDFFNHLNTGPYQAADELYDGTYETLANFNPAPDLNNHAGLWENVCRSKSLQCLTVRSATLKKQVGDIFIFTVEFNNADGTLFVLGPCCGADETQMPPTSQFEYRVRKNPEGKFLVSDLPVYVP